MPSTFSVSGPSSGLAGTTSTNFTLSVDAGAFNGTDTVTINCPANMIASASAPGGAVTNNNTATVTVRPAVGQSSFTFTLTPTPAGVFSVAYTNAQAWTNPGATSYTSQNPVPTLTSLDITSLPVGSPDTLVTLTGTNFRNGVSGVLVNGVSVVTGYTNSITLTAMVPAATFLQAGSAMIAVVNPAPGGGTAALPLTVTAAQITIDEAVYAWLSTRSALTALVGKRIVPDMAPKKMVYPRVVFSRVSTQRQTMLSGHITLGTARYQIDCWGLSRQDASTTGNVVRQAVEAFKDLPSPKPFWGTLPVQAVTIEDEGNGYDPPEDSSDVGAYSTRLDLMISYQE